MTIQDLLIQQEIIKKLEAKLKIAVEALEFITMPISTSKESLTVDSLLETMNEDIKKGKKALKKINANHE